MEYFFWISIFIIFYAYLGYPICLLLISVFKKSNNPTNLIDHDLTYDNYQPAVSFIITAYNEEKRIKEKIEGTLSQDYPKDKLEIIVASDCSTDNTDEIVRSYENQGVKLIRAPERKGKENVQKYAVDSATGEVLVFSDVATMLKPNGISNIVRNFQDPTIGCVSSEDRFIDEENNVTGEEAYVKYEMLLRRLETKVNTLVGLSGSFFAARREACEKWAVDLQSDFNILLNSVKLGLRGISDPNSIGYYKNIADERKEFNRKVRTVLRGISVLMRNLSLLNPIKFGLFSWQMFSHKLCRWLVPFFLILAFVSNAALTFSSVFLFSLFLLQIAFYSLALVYFQKVNTNSQPAIPNRSGYELRAVSYQLFRIPYYFVTVNASILVAWWKYLKGDRATFWEPSKR